VLLFCLLDSLLGDISVSGFVEFKCWESRSGGGDRSGGRVN
jgi:hypothetical protein